MKHFEARREIIKIALQLNTSGLSAGTSGNVSARVPGGFLITPSGVKYEKLLPPDIVFVDMDGNTQGHFAPSSEWRFHRDIYKNRSHAKAIVHAHAPYSTALACLEKDIPPFHYMVAVAGAKSIRCAPYAPFGTSELSNAALGALDGRRACLLAHHGLIAYADNPEKALSLAVEVEALAQQYQLVLQMGEPKLLSDSEMEDVLHRFWTYGDNAQKADETKRAKPKLSNHPRATLPKRR